ncbi:MAG: hypothetical protein AAF218_08205 [Pseudomonadota bacterium]
MTRRRASILLHWVTFTLLIMLIAGGGTGIAWAFAISGLAFAALALPFGLMNGPGPKLEGALRIAHPWLSRAMYLLTAATAGVTLYTLLGGAADTSLWQMILFSSASLHGIFHLWRHTALGDGALRRILPKAMHGML